MSRYLRLIMFLCAVCMFMSCSSVALTGRKRVLLYSDSEITSLADQSYNELMTTAKISGNREQAAMISEVGARLVAAFTKYLES